MGQQKNQETLKKNSSRQQQTHAISPRPVGNTQATWMFLNMQIPAKPPGHLWRERLITRASMEFVRLWTGEKLAAGEMLQEKGQNRSESYKWK